MINDKIEGLHQLMSFNIGEDIYDYALTRRLYSLSLLAYIRKLNDELDDLSKSQDSSLQLDSKVINYDRFLDNTYWKDCWMLDVKKLRTDVADIDINKLTDYLPTDDNTNYNLTPEKKGAYKTAIHQLCNQNTLSDRDVIYAMNEGYLRMTNLLTEIKKKSINPPAYHYVKFWEKEIVPSVERETIIRDYEIWKQEHSEVDYDNLKDLQMQKLVQLLASDFFKYRPTPTKREIDKCKLKIDEDSMESGFQMPEDIAGKCARCEYFIKWKDDKNNILGLNYERIGKYVYEHYTDLWEGVKAMIYFDVILEAIQKDMVALKPQLNKFIEGNEERQKDKLLKDITAIINTCQIHLSKDVRETFLEEYLEKLLNDEDIKDEAIKELSGGSRNTYVCKMVAALKNAKVFMVESDKKDLAKSLHEKISEIQIETLKKNIERAYNARMGNLHEWTEKIVPELMAQKPSPLERII